jgi:antitoxin CptB
MMQTMAENDAKGLSPASRCKRLKYRAWHRGTREMDLLLGPFADAASALWNENELAAFERLLDRRDDELHDLIAQYGGPDDAGEAALLMNLRGFHGTKPKA